MRQPLKVKQLDHFVLHVRDLEKSVAFYRMFGELGKSPSPNTPVLLGPTTRLMLHHDPEYMPQGEGNLQHFALVIEDARNVQDVLDYVRAHGAEPFDGPRDTGHGYTQFRVQDPDGNEIELRIKQVARA